jgi:hypothetical protein
MDAQRIAVDAIVALTDCDREQVTAFIRRLYLEQIPLNPIYIRRERRSSRIGQV